MKSKAMPAKMTQAKFEGSSADKRIDKKAVSAINKGKAPSKVCK